MNPAELKRLESIVDEARKLRNKLTELTTLRERVLELHGPQPENVWKSFGLKMEKEGCELRFYDGSNGSRALSTRLAVSDGIELVEMLLEFIDNRIDMHQHKMEELKL